MTRQTSVFDALIRRKAGFLMMHQKGASLLHYYVFSRFSCDAPKRCKFDALLRGKAGFLMTRQNLLYLMNKYVEKHDATENKVEYLMHYYLS